MNNKTLLGSLVFLFLFICVPTTNAAVTPDALTNFITTWNTENAGTSNDDQITIPGTGAGYSYEIYWENTASSTMNGTTTLITTSSHTLTFPEAGIYEVQIAGAFPRIYFNNGGDKAKIVTVEQWGNIAWTSMANAFYGCTNLTIPATDAPDLSGVTDMGQMFLGASSFNQPIDHWDVSNVVSLYRTFRDASQFNQTLDSWDVSKVTSLFETFLQASSFNQPLDSWDVSKVAVMQGTFAITPFNQPLNNWDVSNVTNMHYMFGGASAFNQPLDSWDVSNVQYLSWMFYGRSGIRNLFNQDISMWDTSSAVNMSLMFRNSEFNYSLNNWEVSKVTDFSQMFYESVFNKPLDNWNTSSSTNMQWMFYNNIAFNQDISSWNINRVTAMTDMFYNTSLSPQNLDSTLVSWAAQPVQPNVPFHLGLKTYSDTGAAALATLRDTHGWIITEQYKADYRSSSDAILNGTSIQSPLNSGDTTTAVTINPKKHCNFEQWSDGNTNNPRTDVLTDNLSVTAELHCQGTQSTSAGTQADRLRKNGNETQAEIIENKYLSSDTPSTFTPPATLAESLAMVATIPETLKAIDPVKDRAIVKELIATLLELVKVLTLLLAGFGEEGV